MPAPIPPAVARRLALARARALLVSAEAAYAEAHGEPVTLAASVVAEGGEILAQERAALSLADRLATARPSPRTRDAAESATVASLAAIVATALTLAVAFRLGFGC